MGDMWPLNLELESMAWGLLVPRQVSPGQGCWPSQMLSSVVPSFLGPFETFRQGPLPRETHNLTHKNTFYRQF